MLRTDGAVPGLHRIRGSSVAPIHTGTKNIAGVRDVGGTGTQGEQLGAGVSDADGTSGVTISYQWKRGGTSIDGATSSSYTLTQADVGAAITVTASYTDELNTAESRTSAETSNVTNVNDTGSVAISGTVTQGEQIGRAHV